MSIIKKDLVILVADDDIRLGVDTLLSKRTKSLGIRNIQYEINNCINRDNGCYKESEKILRSQRKFFNYALVMFDREGSGKEACSVQQIQDDVQNRLSSNGWNEKSAVIVFDPEFDIWFWNDSNHVAGILGWEGNLTSLHQWLIEKGLLADGEIKPVRPKEAMEAVLKSVRKVPSASLFQKAAERVTLQRCVDPGFQRFLDILRGWFPVH